MSSESLPTVKILLAYHKPAPLLHTDVFTPIHVGRALASDESRRQLSQLIGDDTGEHISDKNPSYAELTAAYWAWKNLRHLGDPDYIGLGHYRRIFNFGRDLLGDRDTWLFEDFSSASRHRFGWADDRVRSYCQHYDIIVDKPWQVNKRSIIDTAKTYGRYTKALARRTARLPYSLTIYEHYENLHVKEDLNQAIAVVKSVYPEMAGAVDRVMNSRAGYYMNMFVMRRPVFEDYCEWLFGILSEVERRIDCADEEHQGFHARVFGFLGERLINVWLEHARSKHTAPLIGERQVLWAKERKEAEQEAATPVSSRRHVHVAFAPDDGYAAQTGTAITSLLLNAHPNTSCHIYILDAGLSEEHRTRFAELAQIREDCTLDFRRVDLPIESRGFDGCARKSELPWVSGAAYHRFLLPSILSELDRVIYLDGDLIVRRDLGDLFDTRLDGQYVAMASDAFVKANLLQKEPNYFRGRLGIDGDYFNSGVMVLDLAKMRADAIESQLLRYRQEHGPFKFVDQDVLNAVLKGCIKKLDQKWNMTQGCWSCALQNLATDEAERVAECRGAPSIMHYAGEAKPWSHFDTSYRIPFGKEYWYYHELSPWAKLANSGFDKQRPAVSVVIPAHNDAVLLAQCLRSLVHQTLENVEIIVVARDSDDDSAAVGEDFASRDPRIRVLRNDCHGVFAARNAGLSAAIGEYVGFVEGDDWVDPMLFERLYRRAQATDADVVVSNAHLCLPDGSRQPLRNHSFFVTHESAVLSAEKAPAVLWCAGDWGKLYRRSFVDSHRIGFPAALPVEDDVFRIQAMVCAKRISLVSEQLYFHRRSNAALAVHATDDDLRLQYLESMRRTRQYFEERREYDRFRRALLRIQSPVASRHFRTFQTRRCARVFFDGLRAMLDATDYEELAKMDVPGIEPVADLAYALRADRFTAYYYCLQHIGVGKRSLQARFRRLSESLRRGTREVVAWLSVLCRRAIRRGVRKKSGEI